MAKRNLSKAAERVRETRRKKRQFRAQVIGFVKDILVAMLIVVIVMSLLYAVSGGIWPPMVVVESESMQHGTDSHIGTIDTGDLTLVKKISSRLDIVTYVEGRPSYNVSYDIAGVTKAETFKGSHPGFSAYSDYGEVIIYEKNGRSSETPIIHRAIVWFVPNTTADCIAQSPNMTYKADFPDIKNAAHPNGLRCVSYLTIHKVGFTSKDLSVYSNDICINAVIVATDKKPFAGFLTHGDNNGHQFPVMVTDQQSLPPDGLGRNLAPVKVSWIVGKAVGELPWFGALNLVASKTRHAEDIPQSSWNGLIATIVLIFVVPFIVDIAIAQYQKRTGKKKKKKDDEDLDDEIKKSDE